jgi:hypothetical protein
MQKISNDKILTRAKICHEFYLPVLRTTAWLEPKSLHLSRAVSLIGHTNLVPKTELYYQQHHPFLTQLYILHYTEFIQVIQNACSCWNIYIYIYILIYLCLYTHTHQFNLFILFIIISPFVLYPSFGWFIFLYIFIYLYIYRTGKV